MVDFLVTSLTFGFLVLMVLLIAVQSKEILTWVGIGGCVLIVVLIIKIKKGDI